ncbi:MAG: cache domain-containing protein [Desulfobacterales bacterium]|nr:cache domain-containing protein [Desulfobacterales bacterium]
MVVKDHERMNPRGPLHQAGREDPADRGNLNPAPRMPKGPPGAFFIDFSLPCHILWVLYTPRGGCDMRTLQAKMLLMLIPGTFLLFTAAVAFLGYDTSRTITDYAYRTAAQYAREGASLAERRFQESRSMFESTARLAETLKREGRTDRDLLPRVCLETLRNHDSIFALWILFEPDAWDGRDARPAVPGGGGGTGSFAIWAYRVEDGKAVLSEEAWASEAYGEDYYAEPLARSGLWLSEPYDEEVEKGRSVRMITLARRLEDSSGKVLGARGNRFFPGIPGRDTRKPSTVQAEALPRSPTTKAGSWPIPWSRTRKRFSPIPGPRIPSPWPRLWSARNRARIPSWRCGSAERSSSR